MTTLILDGDLEKLIIKLIADAAGVDPQRISIETSLNHDLGIDGDDAAELLDLYSKSFGVDLSDFRFLDYFRHEPHLLNFLAADSRLAPIMVSELVKAAKQKKWTA